MVGNVRKGHMRRGNQTSIVIALVLAIVLIAATAGAGAQDEFPPGEWEATTAISGWMIRDGVLWSGHFNVNFNVSVEGFNASGEFRSGGGSEVTLTNGHISMHTFAHGTITGSPGALTAQGQSTNNGIGTFGQRTQAIEGSGPVDGVTIDVTLARCHEVMGTWTQSLPELLEQLGWTPSLVGDFVAVGEPDDLPDHLENLQDRLLDLTAEYGELFDAYILGNGIDWPQMRSMINEAVALENELANLADCEQRMIDEDLRKWGLFYYGPAAVIEGIIRMAIGGFGFDGIELDWNELIWVTDAALELGLIGPAAADQDQADELELHLKVKTASRRSYYEGRLEGGDPSATYRIDALNAHADAMEWEL